MEFKLIVDEIKPTILPAEGEVEQWRVIEACPKYEVSNFGRVRHVVRKHILTPKIDKGGYHIVYFYSSETKKIKGYRVHRLVAFAFCDGYVPGEKELIDHIDHCPSNNYYKNLRFVSKSENSKNRLNSHRSFVINVYKMPVALFDKNSNELIATYNNIVQASNELNLSIEGICENIHRRRKPYQAGYFVLVRDLEKKKDLTK